MSTLIEIREQLAEVITEATGIPSSPFLVERIVPPVALVSQGSPYVQYQENVFNSEMTVQLRVDLVMATATNVVSFDKLDETIEAAVAGLLVSDFYVDAVSAPYALDANNAKYMSVTITVTKPKTF